MATYKIGDNIIIKELNKPSLNEDQGIIVNSNQYANPLKFYQKNLQGKTVNHSILGNIYLGAKGRKETRFRSNSKYLAVICVIDKIIETGYSNGHPEQLDHTRSDDIQNFYSIFNEVTFGDKSLGITVIIAEDSLNKKYYMFRSYKNESLLGTLAGVSQNEKLCLLQEASNNIIQPKPENVTSYDLFNTLNEQLQKFIEEN